MSSLSKGLQTKKNSYQQNYISGWGMIYFILMNFFKRRKHVGRKSF